MSYVKIIILFFAFAANTLLSQSSGYYGKRVVAGYGFYFSPAIFGTNASGNTIIGRDNGNGTTGEFAFNSLHEGFLECAVANRFLLGVSVKLYKTTYDNSRELSAYTTDVNQYGYTSEVSYYGSPEGLYNIAGQNYSLYAKLFNKRYVAPWGRYMHFGVTVRKYTCSYDPNEMKLKYGGFNNYVYPDLKDFGDQKQQFTKFDLMYGFGRTRIIANRITLDYGLNANVFAVLSTFFDIVTDGDGLLTNNVSNYNYFKATSPWRVRGVNKLNAFLKVGFLLF